VLSREALGWRSYHTFGARRSAPGFPDLVLVKPPRVVVAELKRETGRLSSEQAEWIALLERCPGVECHVWRPGNLPWIEATLRVPPSHPAPASRGSRRQSP
jgi:hypothetical protein